MAEQELTLNEVTTKLGSSYREWKKSEKDKESYRKDFFDAVTKTEPDLEQKYLKVNALTPQGVEEFVAKKYPRWRVADLRPDSEEDHSWEVIIEERPEFKTYSYVNKDDGFVYTKQVSSGSIFVDDERLADENPSLYEQVTVIPEPQRQLRPLEELEPELLAKLAEYMYEGPPKVSLAAPRKAKPEELG